MLDRIWEEQMAYNSLVKAQVENPDWLGTLVLGLMEECSELLRAAGWKKHRKPAALAETSSKQDLEELADLLKYVLSLTQEQGYDLHDLLSAVQVKNEAMRQRLEQEFSPPPAGRKVLVVDLDGTLADFAGGMREQLGIADDVDDSVALDTSLGISYPQYWTTRRKWEEAGGYRRLKPYAQSVEIVHMVQRTGIYVVAATARPRDLKRVWYDSLLWLLANGIQPDRLVLADSERILLVEQLIEAGCSVVLMDDDPTIIKRAVGVCPVLVVSHGYNRDISGVVRVEKLNLVDLGDLWVK